MAGVALPNAAQTGDWKRVTVSPSRLLGRIRLRHLSIGHGGTAQPGPAVNRVSTTAWCGYEEDICA